MQLCSFRVFATHPGWRAPSSLYSQGCLKRHPRALQSLPEKALRSGPRPPVLPETLQRSGALQTKPTAGSLPFTTVAPVIQSSNSIIALRPGFYYPQPSIVEGQVSLCGEFNGWSPSATPMKRHDDGHWETTVALAPGRYQYEFLVDGDWLLDPAVRKNVPNDHGSLNSVVEVRA